MKPLEKVYKLFLKQNPESNLSYEEWINENILPNLDYVVMNSNPYVSDDFQIGPDGAYEHKDD